MCRMHSHDIGDTSNNTDVKRKSNLCEPECDHVRSWAVGSIRLCGSWTFPSKNPENNYWAPNNVRLGRWRSCNMFMVTFRHLTASHTIEYQAMHSITFHGGINWNFNDLVITKESHYAQTLPLIYCWPYIFLISLTSLKNITINYLRDLPLYAHYGWLHPPSLLVKWPWEGGHSCLPQAPGSSELWPEQPRGNGLGSAKDMSWEHTIYRNMMGIWFGISWKYHK